MIPDELYESALMQALGAGYERKEALDSSAGGFWNNNNRDGIVTRELGSWEEGDSSWTEHWHKLAIFELPTSIDDTSVWQEIAQSIQSQCNGFNAIGYRIESGIKNGRTVKYLSVAAARGIAC